MVDIQLPGFEGAEKILKIVTCHQVDSHANLLSVSKESWQKVLDAANCTIISEIHNDSCRAFVLSESSLFVYPNKCIVKTCGRTTLLLAVPLILQLIQSLGLSLEYILYSFKSFLFPEFQIFPHSNVTDAECYLKDVSSGGGLVLGDSKGDHIYLFTTLFPRTVFINGNGPFQYVWNRACHIRESCSIQGDITPNQLLHCAEENDEETDSLISSNFRFPRAASLDALPLDDTSDASLVLSAQSPSSGILSNSDDDYDGSSMYYGSSDTAIGSRVFSHSCPYSVQRSESPRSLTGSHSSELPTLNMMMYGMSERAAKWFLNPDGSKTAAEVTKGSGIGSFYEGALIDDYLFTPCGYSMNGLLKDGFFTIHITPEKHCSYVSFETNIPCSNYLSLIQQVLSVFEPSRFTMSFSNPICSSLETFNPVAQFQSIPSCMCSPRPSSLLSCCSQVSCGGSDNNSFSVVEKSCAQHSSKYVRGDMYNALDFTFLYCLGNYEFEL